MKIDTASLLFAGAKAQKTEEKRSGNNFMLNDRYELVTGHEDKIDDFVSSI